MIVAGLVLAGCDSASTKASSEPSRSPTPSPAGTPSYRLGFVGAPDFIGPGAAGACSEDDAEIVTVVFEQDTPSPRCLVVTVSQRLRVVNNVDKTVTARLGGAEITLPPGTSVTFTEPFSIYMVPGGHYMTTDLYSGGVEFRLAEGGTATAPMPGGRIAAGIRRDELTRYLERFLDARMQRMAIKGFLCCDAASRENQKWYGYGTFDMIGYRVTERHDGGVPTQGFPYFVVDIVYERGAEQYWNGRVPIAAEFIVVGRQSGDLNIIRWADEGTS